MIGKQDILDRAKEWQLRPGVVEKDYVLGWVLAALAQHPETSTRWPIGSGYPPGTSGSGSASSRISNRVTVRRA